MRNAGVILGGVIGAACVLAGIAAVRMPAKDMLIVVLVVAGLALVLTVVLVLAWVIRIQEERDQDARELERLRLAERPRPVVYLVDGGSASRPALPAPAQRWEPYADCERMPALPAGKERRR